MPLIPATYINDDGKIGALIIIVTDEEYQQWRVNHIPVYKVIPIYFLDSYLEKRGKLLSNFNAESVSVRRNEKLGNDLLVDSGHNFFSVNRTREILNFFELPFDAFIDDYAGYLKSL